MKKSIFSKIFGGYILIIFALSSLILIFSFRTIKSHYINTLTTNLKNLAFTFNLSVTPLLKEQRFQQLDKLVKNLGKNIDTRITVIAPDGTVYADSEKDPKLMENHKSRPEIIEALQCKIGRSLRFSTTVKEQMLYVAVPIKNKNKIIGILRASLFIREINTLLNHLKIRILQIVLIIILFSLIGALIFSRSLSKPIRELANASQKIAHGDFNIKIFFKNEDELKELADNFNYMTEKIKTLVTDLTLKKEELNGIISSIQEGLIVVNKEGRIVLYNESFKRIIQTDSISGKFYWEILKSVEISELIKRSINEKKNLSCEVELNEKMFLFSITFLADKEEVIMFLHDITEFKRLEKIKKDFVVNVSHELRTPLTAMKGYVETLDGEVKETGKHYLDIVGKNTDRLINIVQDLLLLSGLEEKGVKLELETVDLNHLVETVLKIFKQKAEIKNIKLNLISDGEKPVLMADSFKLEQMFINLIDNAIKYTERGEINILLSKNTREVKIEIKDTGIGIPREHLPRIFERFYVVDKSRSRKLGGTGLGLSIVKHIVLLHDGTIDVVSKPRIGTTFTIKLPLNISSKHS
ncbi:MAG TPA: HAMP domain-containing protein [Bacteroidetes bacterium]|nr:HAMP domain-containing protein [Bacteroidota bacterium]